MMGVSSGCGLCPWSCSGKVGAYELLPSSVVLTAIREKVALIGNASVFTSMQRGQM